mmetsp:Transcript_44787/g.83673  ORF Transcript_44787/g.83673 Transcript_44787/m.83673 type:complete len:128 (+) Transcript_44787:25-408(+)
MISPADSELADKEQSWLWRWNQQRADLAKTGKLRQASPWVRDMGGRPYLLLQSKGSLLLERQPRGFEKIDVTSGRSRRQGSNLLRNKSAPSMAVSHYDTEQRRAFQIETSVLGDKYSPSKPRFLKGR